MQQPIHWDFAETFSGRDATFLIAGFDPSSNSPEDAYKVQPVLQKLKEAYYLACAEVRHDLDHTRAEYDRWTGLHQHRYEKAELLSVKLEGMINNFMNSSFVANGHLSELQGLDRYSETFDRKHNFPHLDAHERAQNVFTAAKEQMFQYWEELDSPMYSRLQIIQQEISAAEGRQERHEITFNEYNSIVGELMSERAILRSDLLERTRHSNPEIMEKYSQAYQESESWDKQLSDWNDGISSKEDLLREKHWHLYTSAVREGDDWQAVYIHEFDSQRFSRSELCRWLSDNNYPTRYPFTTIQPTLKNNIAANQRNSLLLLVAALAKECKIECEDRHAAATISRMVDGLGASVSSETVRKYLDAIPDVLARRSK